MVKICSGMAKMCSTVDTFYTKIVLQFGTRNGSNFQIDEFAFHLFNRFSSIHPPFIG